MSLDEGRWGWLCCEGGVGVGGEEGGSGLSRWWRREGGLAREAESRGHVGEV